NRVFIVGGKTSVFCYHRPVVIQPPDFRPADIDHRLNCQRHSRLETDSTASLGKIRNLRILMEACSDSMAAEIPHYAISKTLRIIADRFGNFMKMMSGFRIFDTLKKALPRHLDQFLRFWADLTHR